MIPRIHLALDNCFASKRWTEPIEWMQIARDVGVFCVEASADNECDPLHNTPDTLQAWIEKVQSASAQTGVEVVNLYSGHGTYATLGLAHTDPRVRDHIQHHWLKPMIHNAAALGAGLGFFCHAFPQSVLADPTHYEDAVGDLFTRLSELATVAAREHVTISVEQMYSPHQIPWTISGSQDLLKTVYARHQSPLYLTLDTGHQTGQRRHLQPDIEAYIAARNRGEQPPSIWLGPLSPDTDETLTVEALNTYVQERPYLFATPTDGDLYAWLRTLGCYSPIIHLQQTDGTVSAHRPFTEATNRTGIVKAPDVLKAIWESYQQPADSAYPPPCADIYLTLEIFSGTADHPAQILANIRESAAYWRQFVPQDGLPLDQLISKLD
jgi:sugar phosphate isomerase/epimerase